MRQPKKMLAQLPIGVALTSIDGRVLDMNPKALELLDVDKADLHDLHMPDLYVDKAEREELIACVRANGRCERTVTLNVAGEARTFGLVSVRFKNHEGELLLTSFWQE